MDIFRQFHYSVESRMMCLGKISIICALAALTLMVTSSTQTGGLQPGFGPAMVAVRQAEEAGATKSELTDLVTLLNEAVQLNNEALKLNAPNQAEKRVALLTQVDQILLTVESQAADLTVMSSHRTYVGKVLDYVWGAIAAVLLTVTYAFVASIREKYQIKRTFQMKVSLR